MLLTSHHLFAHSTSIHSLYFTRNCNLFLLRPYHLNTPPHFPILNLKPLRPDKFTSLRTRADPFRLGAYESECSAPKHAVGDFNFDSLLSLLELSCLLSSAIVTVGVAVNSVIAGSKKELLLAAICNRVLLWGVLMMVVGVLIGAWIRRRQWRRVSREMVKGGLEVNLLERIEKLEEDLRSTVTVVRVLSRQLEKLGIRFRVTRKSLKEPITEELNGSIPRQIIKGRKRLSSESWRARDHRTENTHLAGCGRGHKSCHGDHIEGISNRCQIEAGTQQSRTGTRPNSTNRSKQWKRELNTGISQQRREYSEPGRNRPTRPI